MLQNVDRHGKYDGGVVLGGDAAQGLKISQLEDVLIRHQKTPDSHPHLQG